jgi:hypothetical protein
MIDETTRFEANSGEVAASLMDDELVVINLSTGVYYSTEKAGAEIWRLIELGFSVSEIVDAVAAGYDAPSDVVRPDVESLLKQLVDERVILVREAPRTSEPYEPRGGGAYESPVFHIYKDMSDLLALDAPMPDMDAIPWKNDGDG